MSQDDPPSLRSRIAGEHSWLRRRARRVLGPGLRRFEDSQDLAQRVHMEALKRGPDGDFERRGALRAWLGRILSSTAVDAARRAEHRRADALPERLADDHSSPSMHASRRELPRAVLLAMSELPERERRVLTLRLREDLSFAEIARHLDLAEGHTRQIFRRSIQVLRARTNVSE